MVRHCSASCNPTPPKISAPTQRSTAWAKKSSRITVVPYGWGANSSRITMVPCGWGENSLSITVVPHGWPANSSRISQVLVALGVGSPRPHFSQLSPGHFSSQFSFADCLRKAHKTNFGHLGPLWGVLAMAGAQISRGLQWSLSLIPISEPTRPY